MLPLKASTSASQSLMQSPLASNYSIPGSSLTSAENVAAAASPHTQSSAAPSPTRSYNMDKLKTSFGKLALATAMRSTELAAQLKEKSAQLSQKTFRAGGGSTTQDTAAEWIADNRKIRNFKSRSEELVKSSASSVVDEPEHLAVFGQPLAEAVDRSPRNDFHVPAVVYDAVRFIEECGLETEGIYRVPGATSSIQRLKRKYEVCDAGAKTAFTARTEAVPLSTMTEEYDVNTVCSVLKLYLRELPRSILTQEREAEFHALALRHQQSQQEAEGTPARRKDTNEILDGLAALIDALPSCNRCLVDFLFRHWVRVAEYAASNRMDVGNLSIVLTPTLRMSPQTFHALFAFFGER